MVPTGRAKYDEDRLGHHALDVHGVYRSNGLRDCLPLFHFFLRVHARGPNTPALRFPRPTTSARLHRLPHVDPR